MSQTPSQSRTIETPSAPARPKFVRQQFSPIAQYMMAVWIYGLMCPVMRTLEMLGKADKLMMRLSDRMNRNVKENNPYRSYVPQKQDVFVMTLPKSGTNWMMQIAHQLIWHGQAEYD